MKILAIETSFDDTSIAIMENHNVISMKTYSQVKEHTQDGGVIPEKASRLHSKNIFSLIALALKDANVKFKELDSIAVTKGPGLVNTLQIGITVAKTLSQILNIPLYGINHMTAHIYSSFINRPIEEIPSKSLVLLVSGGHTILAQLKDMKVSILGETLDDAIGEAFDKVGKLLDLKYPGGPEIDKIYNKFTGKMHEVPVTNLENYDFSFSGIKSYIANKRQTIDHDSLAAGFQRSVIEQLMMKVKKAIKFRDYDKLIIGGGVASNSLLKSELGKLNISIISPKGIYAVDNAAMIGYTAYYLISKNMIKEESLTLDAISNLKVGK